MSRCPTIGPWPTDCPSACPRSSAITIFPNGRPFLGIQKMVTRPPWWFPACLRCSKTVSWPVRWLLACLGVQEWRLSQLDGPRQGREGDGWRHGPGGARRNKGTFFHLKHSFWKRWHKLCWTTDLNGTQICKIFPKSNAQYIQRARLAWTDFKMWIYRVLSNSYKYSHKLQLQSRWL